MDNGGISRTSVIIVGALIGLFLGCLLTWFPLRLAFCAYYNAPDCEEIVLMVFPFYCFIAPLIGVVIANWLYRRRRTVAASDDVSADESAGAGKGKDL